MPERYEIRGQSLPDGNKSLSPKDVYNLNKNFETVGLEVFGNADFTRKIEKKVKDLAIQTEAIISTVADKADTSLLGNYSTITQTAQMIESAVFGEFEESVLINYSTKTQTATDISNAVVNKADKSEVTQLADSVTQTFTNQKIGGRNLIPNGGFEDGVSGVWTPHSGTETLEDGSGNTKLDGKNLLVIAPPNIVNRGIFRIYDQFIVGKEYTFSAYVFAEDNLWMGVIFNQINIVPTQGQWKRFVCTFTATATSHPLYFLFNDSSEIAGAYIDNVMLQEGNKLTEFTPKEGEFTTTTHKFNGTGYELKDNSGGMLMTPNGMANEQNFGSTQNVESGYPLNMSFEIGDTTSVITSVKLKLKQYNFRTDSKGVASGGGVKTTPEGGGKTSGASSRSTTVSDAPTSFYTATQVDLSYPNEGLHYHRIPSSDTSHSHNMAHTHTTADHSHAVDITHEHTVKFGILELANYDGTIDVYIDGVYRVSTTNTDTTLDITAWVTTNGVHSLALVSPSLKRIQADLFIKSYIRR